MNKKTALIVTAAVTALALTGCTPGGGGVPIPGGPPEPAPTVTVTATPAPVVEPDYGFTFFHGATMGSDWAQMGAQLHMPVGPYPECSWMGGLWNVENGYTSAFMDSRDPSVGVTFFLTGWLQDRSVGANFPRNAEGVGVGSTKAEILAAYPTAVVDTFPDVGAGPVLRITVEDPDSDSKYVFGITVNFGEEVVDMLQWGPNAGGQWSHLCTG